MTSTDSPVKPGTLVLMHGTARMGGKYDGLAFVHEHFEAHYNLVGFEHIRGTKQPYVRHANTDFSSGICGWLGGVNREDFTVVEIPEVPLKDGYYRRSGGKLYRRLGVDGWTFWSPAAQLWTASAYRDISVRSAIRSTAPDGFVYLGTVEPDEAKQPKPGYYRHLTNTNAIHYRLNGSWQVWTNSLGEKAWVESFTYAPGGPKSAVKDIADGNLEFVHGL